MNKKFGEYIKIKDWTRNYNWFILKTVVIKKKKENKRKERENWITKTNEVIPRLIRGR